MCQDSTAAKNILAFKWHTTSQCACGFFFTLFLVSMTGAAAVCADEHNLLKAAGFHFLGHFSNRLLFFFVYTGCINGVTRPGHKIPSIHASQVQPGPGSQEVWASLVAATWAWLSLTVMVKNANYYQAVDSSQQHMLWNHTAHLHPAVSKEFAKSSCVKPVPHTSACLCASE